MAFLNENAAALCCVLLTKTMKKFSTEHVDDVEPEEVDDSCLEASCLKPKKRGDDALYRMFKTMKKKSRPTVIRLVRNLKGR